MRRWLLAFVAMVPVLTSAEAPDFPPGVFHDGNSYSLKDLQGKVVVLFFYEQNCPRCTGEIPNRNKVVQSYQGKPVQFIAIAASDSLEEARAYVRSNNLQMPVFADSLGLMEQRYNTKISLQNIWQFRIIGPDGNVAGHSMEPKDIDAALAKATFKFKDKGYDAKLNGAIERFEWGQYAEGMRALKPHLKNSKKEIAESAKKLYDEIKAEGEKWFTDAEAAAGANNPVDAYDLYGKVAATFTGDELGKKANDALKKLAANPEVKKELSARQAWAQFCISISRAREQQKAEAAAAAQGFAKRFAGTPTGGKFEKIAQELGGA
jgi:peroxiredoxin